MFASLAMFRHFHRDVRVYLLTWSLLAFGYLGVWSVLFNLYLLRLGYGPQFIGLLIGAGQLVWAVGALPAGAVGARIGNRNGMALGISVLGVATAVLLINEILPAAAQAPWLIGGWMLSWAGASLLQVNAAPYVMKMAKPAERPHIFTLQQALLALLAFLGALVAGILPGILANRMGISLDAPAAYRYALWLTPLFYLLAVVLILQAQPDTPVRRQSKTDGQAAAPLLLIVFIALIIFLQTLGEGMVRTFFNVYLDTDLQVPTAQIGLIMGVSQLLPVLAALSAPLLMTRWGVGRTLALVGGLIASAFLLLLAFIPNWLVAGLAYMGIMSTTAIAGVGRNLYSQEAVVPRWRTAMSSAVTIGMALGWALAAALGGTIVAGWGFTALFLTGAIMAALSGVILLAYLRMGAPGTALASEPSA
jgi:MFS family permease